MRNNGNNKNESDSHDLQQKSNVSKPTRESIFNTLYNEAQKEIKFHKILVIILIFLNCMIILILV